MSTGSTARFRELPLGTLRDLAEMTATVAAAARVGIFRALLEGPAAPDDVLDLGGGPGHIARAFADEGLEVTLLDTPKTVAWVRGAYGLDEAERIHPVGADFLEDPLPEGPFDVVLLSNVLMKTEGGDTYAEPEYREWLRDAGFGDVEVEDLDRDRQLVTALRGAEARPRAD